MPHEPYTKCLVKVARKAYITYAKVVAVIGLLALAVYLVLQIKDSVFALQNSITTAMTLALQAIYDAAYANVSVVPWWVYLIVLLIALPLIYAALKCWVMRLEDTQKFVIGLIGGGMLGCLVGIKVALFIMDTAVKNNDPFKDIAPVAAGGMFFFCAIVGAVIGACVGSGEDIFDTRI